MKTYLYKQVQSPTLFISLPKKRRTVVRQLIIILQQSVNVDKSNWRETKVCRSKEKRH